MKSIAKAVTAVTLLFSLLCPIMSFAQKPSAKWHLVWEENFNKKSLDADNWGYMRRRRDDSRRWHSADPACYTFKSGKLHLKGIPHPANSTDTATYLTGAISTEGKRAFQNGRLEIRAKLINAQGAWPAIWMLPFKSENGWPADGEIDIMEHLNFEDFVRHNVHTTYTKAHPKIPVAKRTPINVNKFNTYAVEFNADSIAFYVNGKHAMTYNKVDSLANEGQFPFDREWYLMLDMQLGGSWVGPIHLDGETPEMIVDWVRFYKKD